MSTYVERLEHQLAQAKHRHPANNAYISKICARLGDEYVHSGDIAKAEAAYAESYEIRLSINGPDHLRVARSLHGLAICHIRQATTQTTKRKTLLRQAKRSLEEVLRIQILTGKQCATVDIATTYHDLGIVLSKLGTVHRYDALISLKKALYIRIDAFGSQENLLVADTMREIGKAYLALGYLGRARIYTKEALLIHCRFFPPANAAAAAAA
mmetsp:Transcript_14414/g.20283  ORF Transcript_14414/g.20283 Transcript_14414/m.20283 type:complete len:212 (+) Transcript_14414:100-735(+)